MFARQWCSSPDDVVQEAFVALVRLEREPEHAAGWLYRAVRNGAINAGIVERRRRRRETVALSRMARWFAPTDPGTAPGEGIDPDSVQEALARLPEAQREVIVAHLWGGLTFDQVADLVQTSSSSAHRLYHAGLITLRERLGVPWRSKTRPNDPT